MIGNTDFRMPAEWEKQDSTWLAWPHNKNDWPGLFAKIPDVFREIISSISKYQKVNLLVQDRAQVKKIQKYLNQKNIRLSNVHIHVIQTNRVWTRDTGPIYLINKKKEKKLYSIGVLMLGQNTKTTNMITWFLWKLLKFKIFRALPLW